MWVHERIELSLQKGVSKWCAEIGERVETRLKVAILNVQQVAGNQPPPNPIKITPPQPVIYLTSTLALRRPHFSPTPVLLRTKPRQTHVTRSARSLGVDPRRILQIDNPRNGGHVTDNIPRICQEPTRGIRNIPWI